MCLDFVYLNNICWLEEPSSVQFPIIQSVKLFQKYENTEIQKRERQKYENAKIQNVRNTEIYKFVVDGTTFLCATPIFRSAEDNKVGRRTNFIPH